MNISFRQCSVIALAALLAWLPAVSAEQAPQPRSQQADIAESASESVPPQAWRATPDDADSDSRGDDRSRDEFPRSVSGTRNRHDDDERHIVHIGKDSHLPAGERADALVAIAGSAVSEGDVADVVLAILGNTRVTGAVGESAIAVLGDAYVNSSIGGDVIALFGNVELGPDARIAGEVAAVGGMVIRDRAALVSGGIEEISFGENFGRMEWLRTWVKHCLFLGRPLAIEPGLEWAWGMALGFFALYLLLALIFSKAVVKCAQTLETQPGQSVVTALLAMLLAPVLIILLCITLIGIVLVPFVAFALFCAGIFGKVVILAWLGRRITRFFGEGMFSHVALAVLLGGVIVLALYVVPVIGFVVYKLIGILGFGVVVYTLILAAKARRDSPAVSPSAPQAAATGVASAMASAGPLSGDATAADGDSVAAAAAASSASAAPATGNASTATSAAAGVAATLPRAGFWIRMGALLIDALLIGIVLGMLGNGDAGLLALAAYGAVMWKLKGTTIGGILLGLQVVRLDGRELDWGTAIVRALSCFLSAAVAGLGFIWIVFDDERQAWHDKIAGTVVVRAPKGQSLL